MKRLCWLIVGLVLAIAILWWETQLYSVLPAIKDLQRNEPHHVKILKINHEEHTATVQLVHLLNGTVSAQLVYLFNDNKPEVGETWEYEPHSRITNRTTITFTRKIK